MVENSLPYQTVRENRIYVRGLVDPSVHYEVSSQRANWIPIPSELQCKGSIQVEKSKSEIDLVPSSGERRSRLCMMKNEGG